MSSLRIRVFLLCIINIFCFNKQNVADTEPVLWSSTPLAKLEKKVKPSDNSPRILKIYGAKGEYASGQVVFSPGKSVQSATCSISDLKFKDGGGVIPSSAIELQWVRYIPIQRNSPDIPLDELEIIAPNVFPDPFWETKTIPIEYGTLAIINNGLYVASYSNPIWVDIKIPGNAKAGDYTGTLTVTADSQPVEIPVNLHIWDFEMPEKQHVSVINWGSIPDRTFKGERYTDEYWDVLTKQLKFLVEHGQTDFSGGGINLIKETDDGKSGYQYDTELFEKYCEVVFRAGIRQIHLHGVGQGRTISHLAYTSEIKSLNKGNLRKLAEVSRIMKRRGWEGKFTANICDEPFIMNEITYAERVEEIHEAAPGIKVIEALEAEYLGDMDIYCPKLNHLNMWYPRFKQLQDAGTELWYYICLHPTGRYPNRFIDQSMLKHRVLFWIHYLYNLDGYLHWGGNYFMDWDNPYSEKGVGGERFPLGDAVVFYPGEKNLVSSLRFNAQRDGLEDYGYMRVLENKIRSIKERVGEKETFWLDPRQRSLEFCKRVIWSIHDYTRDPQLLMDTREAIAKEIEALDSDPFLIVQTSPPEGTVFPAGPRNLGIRGLVPPGSNVKVNGIPVENIRPSGYFLLYHFLLDGEPTVTIEVEHNGKKQVTTRTFILED